MILIPLPTAILEPIL